MPVKTQQGNAISKDEDKLRFWKEHFERVLNRDDSETAEAIILPSPELLDIDTDPPNVEEVKRAIKALKDGKKTRYRPDICRNAESGCTNYSDIAHRHST